jgi:hypothetical protein
MVKATQGEPGKRRGELFMRLFLESLKAAVSHQPRDLSGEAIAYSVPFQTLWVGMEAREVGAACFNTDFDGERIGNTSDSNDGTLLVKQLRMWDM